LAKRAATPDVIEELESGAEHLAQWIADHRVAVAAAVAAALLIAGAWSGWQSWVGRRESLASNALSDVRSEYLRAMGAAPGDLEVPEPANPEAARSIRQDYAGRFQAVAEKHKGTVAGAMAWMDVAELRDAAGDSELSEQAWKQALAQAPHNPVLEGLLRQRTAQVQEDHGNWAEAAAAHEAAGNLEKFPLRYWALLDAARCFDSAGNSARALELYHRVQQEAPDLPVPAHLRTRFRELEAAQASQTDQRAAAAAPADDR
jgi:tetratricopeptide (TPR) repeat protein